MTVRDVLEVIYNSDNLLIVRDAECESSRETFKKGLRAFLQYTPLGVSVMIA